ncbi:hypothetical protein IA539_02150 [Gordonia sp. zg691]|uniref:hypothetical protein n=1 Tax=Gordonia jinghuaiqii TaxID=2758710 RepID=UPI0016627A8F|nr:hypothetical protein [Gordonia jinghuaiqii]MBD0860014.1 hypothetical protein [Gordonia jinghuaiqii]
MRSPHQGSRGPGGRRGGWQQAELPDAGDAGAWFAGRLPDKWFTGPVDVTVDRDEITVIGSLDPPDTDDDPAAAAAAAQGRASRFREDTRGERMAIADEAQARYARKVSWGVTVGDQRTLFTHLAVPVMTRLRQPERQVLDTLVDAGVARSRADALAWSVKLVGAHTDEWLTKLRSAMDEVDNLRAEGPGL